MSSKTRAAVILLFFLMYLGVHVIPMFRNDLELLITLNSISPSRDFLIRTVDVSILHNNNRSFHLDLVAYYNGSGLDVHVYNDNNTEFHPPCDNTKKNGRHRNAFCNMARAILTREIRYHMLLEEDVFPIDDLDVHLLKLSKALLAFQNDNENPWTLQRYGLLRFNYDSTGNGFWARILPHGRLSSFYSKLCASNSSAACTKGIDVLYESFYTGKDEKRLLLFNHMAAKSLK
jgi:hypothetical protein